MRAYLSRPKPEYLLFTLESENMEEKQVLLDLKAIPELYFSGAREDIVMDGVQIQFVDKKKFR